MILFVIVGVLLGAGAVIFALQNTMLIKVGFLTWQSGEISLALVLIIAILSGVVISLLVSLPEIIGNYLRLKSIQKEKDRLTQELSSYKAMVSQYSTKTHEKTVDSVEVDGGKVSFLE